MKRKIVKQGAATMMISLPSKWIKKNNIKKGQELDLDYSKDDLVISANPLEKKLETEVNISNLSESSIRTIITNTYRLGYNKIKINFDKPGALKIISTIISNNLIGFEIISKESNFCIVENITEPSKEQFENIFSKILLNIDELFDISESMLKGERKDFIETEQKITQFDNFCRRVLSREKLFDEYQLRWQFHSGLNHAQREIFHMLCHIEKNKMHFDKDLISLLADSRKIFNIIKKAYQEKSIEDLEKIHDLQKDMVYKKAYSLSEKGKNTIVIHHLMSSIRDFYLASSPLIGILIQNQEKKDL